MSKYVVMGQWETPQLSGMGLPKVRTTTWGPFDTRNAAFGYARYQQRRGVRVSVHDLLEPTIE